MPAGSADNALQGARLLAALHLARPVARASEIPTPDAAGTGSRPTGPVTPTTPAPAADPNATVTAGRILFLPSAKRCVSRRVVRVKVKAPRGVKVKSVVATVNGRKRGSTKKSKATITLRKLPAGKVRVKVSATLRNGRKLTVKRTYRNCAR